MVAGAVAPLADAMAREAIVGPRRTIVSSVTGAPLPTDADVRALLLRQVTSPVRFLEAMGAADVGIDLWIEAGPGRVLSGLAAGWIRTPVVAIESGGESLQGLLRAAGAAFALGAPLRPAALFDGRWSRPFPARWRPRFFTNPCELAPAPEPATTADGSAGGSPSRMERGPEIRREGEPPARRLHRGSAGASPSRTGSPREGELPGEPRSAMDSEGAQPLIELVRQALAARAELPPSAVGDDSRLLGDLHLNSITVSQIVVELAGRLGAALPAEPTSYANATVAEVAGALEELVRAGPPDPDRPSEDAPQRGRLVVPRFTPKSPSAPGRRGPRGSGGPWRIMAMPGDRLADRLRDEVPRAAAGRGVLACLPPDPDERHVAILLEAARELLADPDADRFVLVQHGGGAASFARTVHLEQPRVAVCVVDVPVGHPRAVEWIVAEAEAASGFAEVHYDEAGRRREPILRVLPWLEPTAGPPIGADDVVLVSGGGKGIAAECALDLARATGVRLALLGRSRPDADPGLAANLDRMAAAGVRFRYAAVDVTDADAVRSAVLEAESDLGTVTAVLHAAGVNVPCLIGSLDEAAFLRTLAPKLGGLRNLLAAVRPDRLKLLVSFGSIIARTGMPGEADYGLANEWLTRLTERFHREHPGCRCLSLEWSVWSGVGMGDRLGRVDSLARRGIEPIPVDAGIAMFRRLICSDLPAVPAIAAGRFGIPPALAIEGGDLPLLRFLERPRVDYPGIELVVNADLTTETDLYLDEHVFRGDRLFPAVMGLEAMAQAAMAVLRTDEPPVFEDLKFDYPILLAARAGEKTTIRLAALSTTPGRVDVVLRTAATGFLVDHFRAVCRFGGVPAGPADDRDPPDDRREDRPAIGLDPAGRPLRQAPVPVGPVPPPVGLSAAPVHGVRGRDRWGRAGGLVPSILARQAGARGPGRAGCRDSFAPGVHPPGHHLADRR